MDELNRYWGYRAFRNGEVIGEGENPIPYDIFTQATEIHWLEDEPIETNLPL